MAFWFSSINFVQNEDNDFLDIPHEFGFCFGNDHTIALRDPGRCLNKSVINVSDFRLDKGPFPCIKRGLESYHDLGSDRLRPPRQHGLYHRLVQNGCNYTTVYDTFKTLVYLLCEKFSERLTSFIPELELQARWVSRAAGKTIAVVIQPQRSHLLLKKVKNL